MKLKITSLLLCASMIGFYACSNENEEGQYTKSSSLRITTDITTRSVIESSTFNSGDQIGILASNGNQTNVCATYNNTKWTLEKSISLTETPALIYAYYPYRNDCRVQKVNVDITSDAIVTGQADYLYGMSAKEASATFPDAFIHFNHALARITLSIKRSAEDPGYGVLSKVRLQNAGSNKTIATSGWMDITTGEISDKVAGTISLDVDYTLSSETVQNVDILVIPAAMETEGMAELALTIDNSQYIVKMPAATWEAEQQYTYPITINRADAHIVVTPAKVGDYYYSDGLWSTEYDANRTCIGIVFALSEEKDGDINVSLSESMHGRIVALEDIGKFAWGPAVDIEGIMNYYECAWATEDISPDQYFLPIDGENQYYNVPEEYLLPYNYYNWPTTKGAEFSLTDYAGRQHSSYLKTEEYPAGYACYSYSPAKGDKGFWYLPSTGGLGRLMMACGIKMIDNSKQKVFNNLFINLEEYDSYSRHYWTSTEGIKNFGGGDIHYDAWLGSLKDGSLDVCGDILDEHSTDIYTKETAFNVRPVASF